MNKCIQKIKCKNFKRFKELSIKFDPTLNLLIGDNESGKSTILLAIDIVLSGSRSKVESIGLEHLFNTEIVKAYLDSDRKYNDLPRLCVEVYLNDDLANKDLEGKFNSEGMNCHGLHFECEPRDDLSEEIKLVLEQDDSNFPFEYYAIKFKTFSGSGYTSNRKFLQHLLLDSTQINNEYATKSYIKTLYQANVSDSERSKHRNQYRRHKEKFRDNVLLDLNKKVAGDDIEGDYSFAIRTGSKSNLYTDLTIKEGEIAIENRGKGRQCFIKTDFALQKRESEINVILLEEPENHLSHISMKKLIRRIAKSDDKQLFIATHSNMISTRLDLRKAILVNSTSNTSIRLHDLKEDTAKFFMKAPDNNVLEFVLSERVVLVEGDAEFILFETMYEKETGEKLEDSNVHVISVGGKTAKRYLDIANLLNIRTAALLDNDGDYQTNCVDRFQNYTKSNIRLFYETNDNLYTFEVCIYDTNKGLCDDLFGEGRRTLTVQKYMLGDKAECAFQILNKKASSLIIPDYIKQAIQWIRQ